MCEHLLTLDVQAVGVFDMYGWIQNFINHLREEEEKYMGDFSYNSRTDPAAL